MSEKKKKSKIREEKLKIKERNYVSVKKTGHRVSIPWRPAFFGISVFQISGIISRVQKFVGIGNTFCSRRFNSMQRIRKP